MPTPDEDLLNGVRQVASRCVSEALGILDHGTPTMKLRLITAVYGRLTALLGQERPNTNEELQHTMHELMRLVRQEEDVA